MTRKPDRWTPNRWERQIPGVEQMDQDDFRACAIPAERVAELLRRQHQAVVRLVKKLRKEVPAPGFDNEPRVIAYRLACTDILTALAKRANGPVPSWGRRSGYE